jgi:predicted DNA-binding transcriptional regulator AlpA
MRQSKQGDLARLHARASFGIGSILRRPDSVNGRMTADEMRALPAIIDVPTAGRVLGIGRTTAYALVNAGEWPTPVIRVGGSVRIPTAPLLDLVLGQHTAA